MATFYFKKIDENYEKNKQLHITPPSFGVYILSNPGILISVHY